MLELSVSPYVNESGAPMHAAAELIRAKNITKQYPEESKMSHLTMAEASAVEWSTIEMAVMTILPGKHFAQNFQQMCTTGASPQRMQKE